MPPRSSPLLCVRAASVNWRPLAWQPENRRASSRKSAALARSIAAYNTYSFQAPGFYRKLGFRSFGLIRNYPRGASRIFFVKPLA
jgi:ribosomal protein S18 acetylase RimI-like enzyme